MEPLDLLAVAAAGAAIALAPSLYRTSRTWPARVRVGWLALVVSLAASGAAAVASGDHDARMAVARMISTQELSAFGDPLDPAPAFGAEDPIVDPTPATNVYGDPVFDPRSVGAVFAEDYDRARLLLRRGAAYALLVAAAIGGWLVVQHALLFLRRRRTD